MALTERIKYYIGILDDGQLEFRKTRQILDGTDVVGEKHHRQVFEPGQDITAFPNKLQQIGNVVWTPQVISAYQATKAAQISIVPITGV